MPDILIENKDENKDYILVPVTKGKGNVEFCIDDLPAQVYKEVLMQGLKHFVNQGMADIKTTGLEGAELEKARAVAMEKAEKNAEKINKGEIRITGGKAKGAISGAVKTEAMRLARGLVKEALKKAGHKISTIKASDITAAAKELVEHEKKGPAIIKMAEANIKEREEKEKGIDLGDILSSVQADPELVKKADEKKAKAKKGKAGQLSAAQAGKVTQRARPEARH